MILRVRCAELDDAAEFGNGLAHAATDVGLTVRLGYRQDVVYLMYTRGHGVFGPSQIRYQGRDVQSLDHGCLRDNLLCIGHLRQQLWRYEGADLDLGNAGARLARDPLGLGRRRENGRDTLQAIARTHFTDPYIGLLLHRLHSSDFNAL